MVTLLCLIGLITVIWALGKFFTWLGDTLIELDRSIKEARYQKSLPQVRSPELPVATQTDARTVIQNTREKIQNIGGELTNETYLDSVRKEIDELTETR